MARSKPLTLVVTALIAMMVFACSDDETTAPPAPNSFALAFDGINERVFVQDDPLLDIAGAFTLSAWYYYVPTISGVPAIVQKDGPSSVGRYGIWANSDGEIDLCIFIDGGNQNCLMSTGSMNPNSWNHVAATYDQAEMKLYLNGVLDGTRAMTGAVSVSDGSLYIGADPTDLAFLPGQISEVRLWDVARTEAQIQADMFRRLAGSEPNLVGYWRLDDGSGQSAINSSPNEPDGTLGISSSVEDEDPTWVSLDWPVSP